MAETMTIQPETPVGLIAAKMEASLPFFEKVGIDYVNEGEDSLQTACRKTDLPLEEALRALEAIRILHRPERDWGSRPTAELVSHLLGFHHAFTRSQIERIHPLLAESVKVLGFKHPQLLMLKDLFLEMAGEMRGHMSREEEELFPYLVHKEEAEAAHQPLPNPFTQSPFFRQPVRILEWEHRMTGEEWVQVRLLTDNFRTGEAAGPVLRDLYQELRLLEEDLHRHVHLENNVLFKRAIDKGWIQ